VTRLRPLACLCYLASVGCASASHGASLDQATSVANDTFVVHATGAANGEFSGHAEARIRGEIIWVTLTGAEPPLVEARFGLTTSGLRPTKITLVEPNLLSMTPKWRRPGFGYGQVVVSAFGLYSMESGSVVIESITANRVVGSLSAHAPYSNDEGRRIWIAHEDSVPRTPLQLDGWFSARVTTTDSASSLPGG
jgi:hypothetical protein